MAAATYDFPIQLFLEIASIAQICQAVDGSEFVEFFVVLSFHTVVINEFADGLADRDVVTVAQGDFLDWPVIDEGFVGGAKVSDQDTFSVTPDPAVLARYAAFLDLQPGLNGPTNNQRLVSNADAQPQLIAMDNDQKREANRIEIRA